MIAHVCFITSAVLLPSALRVVLAAPSPIINPDVNIALNKPAFQSSTDSILNTYFMEAKLAVDGFYLRNGKVSSSQTQSKLNTWHWWMVDLQTSSTIRSICVSTTLRTTYKTDNVHVEVTESDPRFMPNFPKKLQTSECSKTKSTKVQAAAQTCFRCAVPVKGRYIRVVQFSDPESSLYSDSAINSLTITEFEAYETDVTEFEELLPKNRPSIALNKPSKLSSTYVMPRAKSFKFDSKYAVDGIRTAEASQSDPSCAATSDSNDDRPHWFMLDLQDNFVIDAVAMTTSGDDSYNRLTQFQVEVTEDDPETLNGFPWQVKHASVCASVDDEEIPQTRPTVVKCVRPVAGRYVRLVKISRGEQTQLYLCEFDVFGVEKPLTTAALTTVTMHNRKPHNDETNEATKSETDSNASKREVPNIVRIIVDIKMSKQEDGST